LADRKANAQYSVWQYGGDEYILSFQFAAQLLFRQTNIAEQ